MKKKIIVDVLLIILGIAVLFLVLFKKGSSSLYYAGYDHKNFVETLEVEDMELLNKDYKETDKQAIIYLFRGQGCGFCRSFLSFLNSISEEYGKYFKVVSFEVWNDDDNESLMNEVSKVTGKNASGVPYIVIGNKTFGGYISDWDEDIKAAIKEAYDNNDYDVFEELVNLKNKEEKKEIRNILFIILSNLVFVSVATFIILNSLNNNKKELMNKLNNISTNKVVEEVKNPKKVRK